ncbi:MAG: hypothetical protein CSB21_01665 [Deltaproteobacteria bacterium]|nr:MAG: hypothetical protein CSB21_01665 [Deltaproteobacteria bacterium]
MKIPSVKSDWGSYIFFKEFLSGVFRYDFVKKSVNEIFKADFGVKSVLMTDLGRQCLFLALKGSGFSKNSEVIIPSYACNNVILPVIEAGMTPVFTDSGEDLTISIEHLKEIVNENTKIIIVPHIYGKIAAIKEIMEIAANKNIMVIDDAAQVFGAKLDGQYVGTFGDFGVFSFGPFKSIMATKGGILLKNTDAFNMEELPFIANPDDSIKRIFKSLIKFRYRKYFYRLIVNSKIIEKKITSNKNREYFQTLNEISPAAMSKYDLLLLRYILKNKDKIINQRVLKAVKLTRALGPSSDYLVLPDLEKTNIFTKYPVIIKEKYKGVKNKFLNYLKKNGIEASEGYIPLHRYDAYKQFIKKSLPEVEKYWNLVICLPMYSKIKYSEIEYIAKKINDFKWG